MRKLILFITAVITLGSSGLLHAQELTATELLNSFDEMYRHESSRAVMQMTIITPKYERKLKMQSLSFGTEYSLIKMLSPKKDKGIATLKQQDQMWNFFPKINKVVKVPPSMMMSSWMGSDFTNDDLVQDESLENDYLSSLVTSATEHKITLIPHADTVTVWGKIELALTLDGLPIHAFYYDDNNVRKREIRYSDIQEINGQLVPMKMELIPLNKPGQKTVMTYIELEFDVNVDEKDFSLRALKKK
ncbi:MAG: outer membrane lipoprotein-sorting protein [Saccharospirillaceae bacterium]|nr:outer membrane lipoprotein-sorting protein [Pseudomonadales bacterium]NRB79250.1 outer membrane lipoprotein-sorting protein [Saccharospirillaceae bacterium]